MPLLQLFIIPVWPVHRRLLVLKIAELPRLDAVLDARGDSLPAPGPAEFEPLLTLLAARREVGQVGTWPFDTSAITRQPLYLQFRPASKRL